MSADTEHGAEAAASGGGVREAFAWLMAEAERIPYGEVGVTLTIHDGRVTKIERRSAEKHAVLPAGSDSLHSWDRRPKEGQANEQFSKRQR